MITYHLGTVILGQGLSLDVETDFTGMFLGLVQSMIEADPALFVEQVWPTFMPMLVGGIPTAVLTWIGVYAIFFRLTETYHKRRLERRKARIMVSAPEIRDPDTVP